MQFKKTIIIALIIFILAVYSSNVNGRGLGIGPAIIELSSALRGANYQQTLFIYNENENDNIINLSVTGEIKDWISFYEHSNTEEPVKNTLIPANSVKSILVKINIPKNISNGLYNGTILASTLPITNASGNASHVILTMPCLVRINVTGVENLNVTIEEIRIDKTEIGYPLDIIIDFLNTGNVIAEPKINVNITKDNIYIDRFSYQKDKIQPGAPCHTVVQWNTTGMVAGTYVANITITLGKKTILQKDIEFQLLPPGTLTANGTIKQLTYQGILKKGNTIKIIAKFMNTGLIQTKAKFIGEVYINGQLVKTIESEELLVQKYTTRTLVAYLPIDRDGDYLIKGYVVYSGKTTPAVGLKFQIGMQYIPPQYIGVVIGGVVIAAVAFFIVKKKQIKPLAKKLFNNKNKK
ncbi:MAG: hypothetical protein J7J89_05225 [Thermoplasmata archaeon]|nr:hypothetical protein [Thermoplasmata archaeon]